MSDEPTNYDTKANKKKNSGNGNDFKPQKKNSKDYQVYFEAKGSEKGPKDQTGPSKSNSNASHQDDQHPRKGSMGDNHQSNKSKSHAKNRKESRDQTWKKKYPKVTKELIIELYLKTSVHKDIDELVTSCSQLFVKDKQIPVNKEEIQLDLSEALIPKTTYAPSGNTGHHASGAGNQAGDGNGPGNVATGKNLELTEAPVNTNDSIQAMRDRMKRDKTNKEKREPEGRIFQRAEIPAAQPQTEKPKEENKGDNRKESKESQEESQKSFDEKEKENKNSQSGEGKSNVATTSEQAQKETEKEEATTGASVTDAEAQRNQNERTEAKSPTRSAGVDFSKLSFDNEMRGDDFNQQNEGYGGNSNKNNQQRVYQDNPNANYGNPEMYQQNTYGGLTPQQIQQMQQQQQYNKYNQGSSSPTGKREGSLTNIPKPSAPPTIVFKYFSPNYEEKIWSYIDLEGKFQGPFSGRTMDEWHSKGYLPAELNVTIGKNSGFKALKELIDIIVTHNSQQQAQSPIPKESTPKNDYQYPQQQQQQQQYYQQQQQQYQQQQNPNQYNQQQQQRQYQQYQQQQQQYQQQQNPNPNQYNQQRAYYQQQSNQDIPRTQSEYNPYDSNTQQAYGRTKNMGQGFDSNNAYYGSQSDLNQYGGGSQGNVIYGKVTEIANPQTYYSTPQYFNQDNTPKTASNYTSANYKQGGGNVTNANAYYQEQSPYSGNTGYNQTAYNQPQKAATQFKGNYQQGSGQNYPANTQTGSYGGNFGGQNMSISGGRINSGDFNMGQFTNQNTQQTYSMQQQQQQPQMIGRTPSMGNVNMNMGMGMNQNVQGDMAVQLKNMLGMARPPSNRQDGADYQ